MSDPLLPQDDASTPFTDEEREGLELSFVTTRGDLNAAEYENILQAEKWAFKRKKNRVLNRDFLNDLHQRMYGNVWKWAGHYRTTGKIHPYPNGNGRHSRLATDLLMRKWASPDSRGAGKTSPMPVKQGKNI